MSMPSEINALLARFNKELDRIEQEALKGLQLAKTFLESERFSHQSALIQTFALFNNVIFFVNTQRIRLQIILDKIDFWDRTLESKVQKLTEGLDDGIDGFLEVQKNLKSIIQELKKIE